ncbi:hypothetical protein [Streptomyces justiciae]|uniref:hypothetical protein n=1 Tax=Streptomyces justiciae TaxID=2780140 RepID=UPI0021176172|nr:hypothetical protein [Streptomyces justiciae]MCW8383908.1 hypothetical protein [Streptomyces justiciae]
MDNEWTDGTTGLARLQVGLAQMWTDLHPAAVRKGAGSPVELVEGWPESVQEAYFLSYAAAACTGKTGKELTGLAGMYVLSLLSQSDDPYARDMAAEMRTKVAHAAYTRINDEMRQAGNNPSFTAISCSECSDGRYREDIDPDPKWQSPEARWTCARCGHPLDTRDLVLEPGEDWAIKDHTLGYVIKEIGSE